MATKKLFHDIFSNYLTNNIKIFKKEFMS